MAVLEAIRPEIAGRGAGQTIVRDVRMDVREDSSGEEALFFILVLNDPPPGHDSWATDDLQALRNITRGVLTTVLERQNVHKSWYLLFEPETADTDTEDDQLDLDVPF